MRRETAQNRQLRTDGVHFCGRPRSSEHNCGQGKFETEIQGRPCLSLQTLHVPSLNEQKRDGALRHFVQRSSFGFQQDLLPQLATTFSFSFCGSYFSLWILDYIYTYPNCLESRRRMGVRTRTREERFVLKMSGIVPERGD